MDTLHEGAYKLTVFTLLTQIETLHEQLKQWKQPFLNEVQETARDFQEKVRKQEEIVLKNYSDATPPLDSGKRSSGILTSAQTHDCSVEEKQKISQKRQDKSQKSPLLREWNSDISSSFKNYDQLTKNYDEVFKKKQKVSKNGKEESIEDYRKDEREIIEGIYEELKMDNLEAVEFEAIEEFFEYFSLFYYYYNIHPHRLFGLLKESAKKYEDKLTKQEFLDFFLIDRSTVTQFASAIEKVIQNICILPEESWQKLKNIFDTLDTFGNEQINLKAFFKKVKNNPSSISLLSTPAVSYPEIKRIYTLEKVIFDLENKVHFGEKTDWQTTKSLIENFNHIEKPTFDVVCAEQIKKAQISKDSNNFILEPKVLEILKQIFEHCPKYCENFVKTSFYSSELLETGLLKPFMKVGVRMVSSNPLKFRNFEELIKSMTSECEQFVDLDEILQYFSIKGINNCSKLLELYDRQSTSDSEEYENVEEEIKKRRLKKVRSLNQLKKELKGRKRHNFESTKFIEFNFTQKEKPSIREIKLMEDLKQKDLDELNELSKKFKANPIPAALNPERYQKWVECMQRKKEAIFNKLSVKRDQDELIIDYLKSNTKLFEEKKNYQSERSTKPYVYEASPLPWHVSEELLPKIEAMKEERRQNIFEETRRQYVEVYWKNVKDVIIENGENDSILDKINQLEEKSKNIIKANPVPNFAELHRQFAEELEKRKQKFKPTIPKEPNFVSPPKKKIVESTSPRNMRFKSSSPPKFDTNVEIKSTKKFNDLVAFNQMRIAEKEMKMIEEEKEREERLIKQRNFAKFMRKNLSECTKNAHVLSQITSEKLKRFRAHVQNLELQTEQELGEIYSRVLQRPFLFEEASETHKPQRRESPNNFNRVQSPNSSRRNGSPKNVNKKESQKNSKGNSKGNSKIINPGHPPSPQGQSPEWEYPEGIFEKEGEEYQPIQSENLNLSY